MSAERTLADVIAALDSAGARHMVVGSLASTYHGEPRATQDIDIVVELGRPELDRFLQALPDDAWYVDRDSAREALRRATMFNVIDFATGWKIDLIVRKSGEFAAAEFARRIEGVVLGVRACIASAEDTILAKLVWAKASGGSERQMRDVSGIVEVTADDLDRDYIERWLDPLGVRALWQQVSEPGCAEP